jgi:hypothetical protein
MKTAKGIAALIVLVAFGCEDRAASRDPEAARATAPPRTAAQRRRDYSEDSAYEDRVSDFDGRILEFYQRGRHLPNTEIVAEFGQPDRNLSLKEFMILCNEAGVVGSHGDSPIEEAYRQFSGSTYDPELPWSWSRAFRRCRVWLYRWDRPAQLFYGTLHPRRVNWATRESYFFLVRGQDAIAVDRLCHPREVASSEP